jgi:hypothetical protein
VVTKGQWRQAGGGFRCSLRQWGCSAVLTRHAPGLLRPPGLRGCGWFSGYVSASRPALTQSTGGPGHCTGHLGRHYSCAKPPTHLTVN